MMAQTKEGATAIAALKTGLSIEQYKNQIQSGLKWCHLCRKWHPVAQFGKDAYRYDGLSAVCKNAKNNLARARHVWKPKIQRIGRNFVLPRNGDKKQARRRVNYLIDIGILPKPNGLPCSSCGHEYDGERRHEYHHVDGYDSESHEKVAVLCAKCHHRER